MPRVDGFGRALRAQRQAHGMRQADLVSALGNVIARSTLANVEVGRENPSARLWAAINHHLPSWVAPLEPYYRPAHHSRQPPFELAGPYEIVSATYAYTFREHRAPEEILLRRRVRALADGADGYGLQLSNNSGHFDVEPEAIWGGWVEHHERRMADDDSRHLTRFHFDRVLCAGQEHDFAVRNWVRHDEPAEMVTLMFTRPTGSVQLVLNFLGPQPRQVWTFGPLGPDDEEPNAPASDSCLLTPGPGGSCCLRLERPTLGTLHGISWQW